MHEYEYKPLANPHRDIRLLTLLPGLFDAKIQICIHHVPLIAQPAKLPNQERLSLLELRGTVDQAFTLHETRDGRVLFFDSTCQKSSWTHPNPWVNPRLYAPVDMRQRATEDYTALSYAWGPPNEHEEEVYVVPSTKANGSLHASPIQYLKVRRNLFSALRHSRDIKIARTLWVDSICLNQKDPVEKSHQLGRMPAIYELAPKSIVWLGEPTLQSCAALQLLQELGNQIVVTGEDVPLPSPETTQPLWYHPTTPLPYDDTTWQLIESFCQRPYFQRLWIWQELVLSSTRATVQWGPHSAPWSTLQRAILRLFHRASNLPMHIRSRYQHVWSVAALKRTCYFQDILELTVRQQCSEPRDRIYALLGLVDSRLRHRIIPNYTIPTSEVFRLAFVAFAQHSKSLDLLEHCNFQTRNADAPSWVPNWWIEPTTAFLGKDLYFASLRRSASWKLESSETLVANGVQCTTVKTVSPVIIPSQYLIDTVTHLRELLILNMTGDTYVTGETYDDACAITLCAGAVDYGVDSWRRGLPTLDQVRAGFQKHILHAEDTLFEEHNSLEQNDVYHTSIFENCRGRSLFTTHEGHIGIAPPGTQPGDLVTVLLGCSTPVLIRPRHASVAWYHQVIGPAYIHGLMYGEALLGPLPRGWRAFAQHDLFSGLRIPTFRYAGIDEHKTAGGEGDTSQAIVGVRRKKLATRAGETTLVDPRWGPLPDGWRMLTERQESDGDPAPHFEKVDEKGKKVVVGVHPVLLDEGLRKRGVELRKFRLV